MATIHPAATFAATRDDLTGEASLLGAAEIARGVCRRAERVISVLAVDHDRMRRIDGWLDSGGLVTHAAAPEPDTAVLGSVCGRDVAAEFVHRIVRSLVGPLPDVAARDVVVVPAPSRLSPGTLPAGADWVVVVSGAPRSRPSARVHMVTAAAGGLLVSDEVMIDRAVRLRPADPGEVEVRVTRMVGLSPRSVRDLLADDRPRPHDRAVLPN